MARRTGLWTVRNTAFALCRLVTKFSPTISAAYPDSPALAAALASANAACGVLVAEADKDLPVGD